MVEKFLEANSLPIKALLILDNAPSHPPEEQLVKTTKDGKIWTIFMPPNVTPLIQPMDQNVIHLVKLHYRNSLLSKIVSSGTDDIVSFLKNFNLFDATLMISLGWENLKQDTLVKCWNKILQPNNNDFDEEDDIPLAELLQRDEVVCMRRSYGLLSSVFPNVNFSMNDIHEWNSDDKYECEIEEEEENVEPVEPINETETKIRHIDAIKSFDICIKWCQENNIDYSKSMVMTEIQEEAVQKSLQINLKQTSISDFFELR